MKTKVVTFWATEQAVLDLAQNHRRREWMRDSGDEPTNAKPRRWVVRPAPSPKRKGAKRKC